MSRKNPPKKFYEPSNDRRTSADIISEARQSVRTLSSTTRPYTPAQQGRHLFGADGTPATSRHRPPSTFSIGRRHFSDGDTSRPPTGHHRLAPIEDTLTSNAISLLSDVPPTPVQSTHDLDAAVQPNGDVQVQPRPPADIQPRPPTGEPPSRRRRSGDLRTRSHDSHVKSHNIHTGSHDPSSGSHDLHSRSHDLHTVSGDQTSTSTSNTTRTVSGGRTKTKKKPTSQLTISTPSISQSPRSSISDKETLQTSQSDSNILQSDSDVIASSQVPAMPTTPATPTSPAAQFNWDKHVAPILNTMSSTNKSDCEKLSELCARLWTALQSYNVIGRSKGKHRSSVLRTMFQLLDCKDSRLLLRAAKIILAMGVTGNNLLNVSKLLFSISRSESNDKLFVKEQMIEPVVKLLALVDISDALVYLMGAVKLLAGNVALRSEVASCGVMNCLSVVLGKIAEPIQPPDQTSSVLVQLLALLRNLSDNSSARDSLLKTEGLLDRLSSVLLYHCNDPDVAFNLCRLLSKLTQHNEHRAVVMEHMSPALPAFSGLLSEHMNNPDIVVRICFILGNMSSRDDNFRLKLHHFLIMPTLEKLLSHYQPCDAPTENDAERPQIESGDPKTKDKPDDVLVKLVRLIANLTVNLQVGEHIAARKKSIKSLINILEHRSYQESTELVQNVIVTINNLSFYQTSDNYVTKCALQISKLLVTILLEDNGAGLLECVRVYGNLSQDVEVRRLIVEKKIDQLLLLLLDSESRDLVYASCGVLINLTADPTYRSILSDNSGVEKLADVLRDFGRNDWQLASLVCKILWNCSGSTSSSSDQPVFTDKEAQILVELLEAYLDDSQVLDFPNEVNTDTRSLMEEMWREHFVPVAQELMHRITSTDLVPL